MKPVIHFALISILSFSSAAADEILSEEERTLILGQIALCEERRLKLHEDAAYDVQMASVAILIAVGDTDQAIEILSEFQRRHRRELLILNAGFALESGDAETALQLFQALPDREWWDVVKVAQSADPGVSLEPFEQLLPQSISEEQRWIIDSARLLRLSEPGGSPDEWLAYYEHGLTLPGEEVGFQRRLNQFWYYAITFPVHANDKRPWPTEEERAGADSCIAANALFAHGLYEQAFELASTYSDVGRARWISECVDTLRSGQTERFPSRDELTSMLSDYPNDVPRLLVAAAIGNADWPTAVTYAANCETPSLRTELLRSVLDATCDAGVYVTEIREYDADLLATLDNPELRVNLVRSDSLIGDISSMREHVDVIASQFDLPKYGGPSYLVWIAPHMARASVDQGLVEAQELVHRCELALQDYVDEGCLTTSSTYQYGGLAYPDMYVAEAYLILGDNDAFRRVYDRNLASTLAQMGLRNWLRTLPDLADRIAAIDALQLNDDDALVRQWTILEWLDDRGLHYDPPSIW